MSNYITKVVNKMYGLDKIKQQFERTSVYKNDKYIIVVYNLSGNICVYLREEIQKTKNGICVSEVEREYKNVLELFLKNDNFKNITKEYEEKIKSGLFYMIDFGHSFHENIINLIGVPYFLRYLLSPCSLKTYLSSLYKRAKPDEFFIYKII